MRALIQRVASASVRVGDETVGAIGSGLLILLGVAHEDDATDIAWLAPKVAKLRIFADAGGVMNLDLAAVDGGALVVSQFTLHASTRKGNRPSWLGAAPPGVAAPMVDAFVAALSAELGKPVATGRFGADMEVALVNDGPVTIWIDSRQRE